MTTTVISVDSDQNTGPSYLTPNTGPYNCGYYTNASSVLVGTALTALTVNGATIVGVLEATTVFGNPGPLVIAVAGSHPQNLFTSVTSTGVGAPSPGTYLSATASYAAPGNTVTVDGYVIGGVGVTCWAWGSLFHNTFNTAYTTNLAFTFTATLSGHGDIPNPGAWEDPEGHIPPLAYQNVPQTVNYPLNGDGRYWFAANANAPTPDAITFIGDPAFLVDESGLQWSITQAATDGSNLFLAYSTDGSTFTAVQIGPSIQRGSLLNGLVTAVLTAASTFIVKIYSTGGTANPSALPWNVAVAITRNTNEMIAWSSPNPFDPIAYNGECLDEVVPTATLLALRTRLINRLGLKPPLAEVPGMQLQALQIYMLQRIGFASQAANPPPGMLGFCTSVINEAQQTLYRRYAQDVYSDTAPSLLVNPTDALTLDNQAVQLMAVALAKGHYGQPDAPAMQKSVETYLAELYKRQPPNLIAILNDFLLDGQTYLYRRYTQLHTRRWFRWKINPGQRFYSLMDNDEDVLCNYQMDPLKTIEWAGIQDSRNVWYPIVEGIDGQLYTMIDKPWRPARYEIRQSIEIYPSPDQTYWLWMKAHFGLRSFVSDTDKSTIDSELLFLHALANAKAHYGQKDAANVEAMANNYRKELIAGTHGTKRYIPGTKSIPPAIRPTLIRFSGDGSNN